MLRIHGYSDIRPHPDRKRRRVENPFPTDRQGETTTLKRELQRVRMVSMRQTTPV